MYIPDRPELCLIVNKMLDASLEELIKSSYIAMQYKLVHAIATSARLGSAVLIFVAGMNDIIELTEIFESSSSFRIVAIHSEISEEDQDAAFDCTSPNEIKIIIATNSAESSVTLPDVDTVIDLGMHKMVKYDVVKHQEVLSLSLISKASATQRAGRTGRIRPGTVYRLYSEVVLDDLRDHELPEVLRVPLQDTILNLRMMLENSRDFEGVVPLLEDMLDPPEMNNVDASFHYLFNAGIISQPGDHGALTTLGYFVGHLPVSIEQSRVIYYSVLCGLETDGIIIAAALTLPRTPFRIASPFIHKDPTVYNQLVRKTFLAAVGFDKGSYSEPIMLLELLLAYRKLDAVESRESFCSRNGLWKNRVRYFDHVSRNLEISVHSFMKKNAFWGDQSRDFTISEKFDNRLANIRQTRIHMTISERNNLLRLFLLWTQSKNNLLQLSKGRKPSHRSDELSLQINTPLLSAEQVDSLFPPEAIPVNVTVEESGTYTASVNAAEFRKRVDDDDDVGAIVEALIVDLVCIADFMAYPSLLWVKLRVNDLYGYALAIHSKCNSSDEILISISNLFDSVNVMEEMHQFVSCGNDNDVGYLVRCFRLSCDSKKRISKFDKFLKV